MPMRLTVALGPEVDELAKPRRKIEGNLFLRFIEENPKLVQAIAFEAGFLAGRITKSRSMKKLQFSPAFLRKLPAFTEAALKYLPAATASLQPALNDFALGLISGPRRSKPHRKKQ
jgi:hypothetical protein